MTHGSSLIDQLPNVQLSVGNFTGMHLLLVHSFLLAIGIAHASVIVYSPYVQQPSETVASASYTGVASYDNVILKPQPLPNPPSPTSFGVQLQTGTVPGVSIPHQGSLFGFSIELGFATQARMYWLRDCSGVVTDNCATVGLNR